MLPTTSGRCSEAGAASGIGSPPQIIRHRSATMNEMPSVTSTCPSGLPVSGRRIRRSSNPPQRATARAASSAASQRFGTILRTDTPRYAPSINSEPCVRFAIRISPKISENPAARRNSSPPKARLFRVWIIQNCMIGDAGTSARAGALALSVSLGLDVLRRRPVARIHRVLQELLLVIRPELAHVRIRVDDRIDQASFLALDLADIDIAYDVAVHVEGHRPTRRFGLDRAQRLHEGMLVLDLAVD